MKVKSKEAIYVPKNARTFSIMPGALGAFPTFIDKKIVSLDLGNYTIYLGDTIKVKD